MRHLCLCIPGLLFSASQLHKEEVPAVPALEKLMSIAVRRNLPANDYPVSIAELFGLVRPAGADLPLAAVTHRLDDPQEDRDAIWLRADPVHLHPDQRRLILMDQTMFTLDQHDALVLANEVRRLLDGRGMSFQAPASHRWYLRLDELPDMQTTPIHSVIGRDINGHLPTGADAGRWVTLLNEVQMALYANPLNEKRRQKGEADINSLWFWGCGRLPEPVTCEWSRVYCDEEISQALADLNGIPCEETPDSIRDLPYSVDDNEKILVILSFGLRHQQYHDLKGWQDFIYYLEDCWFDDLLAAFNAGENQSLSILTEGRSFSINAGSFYKFWRRNRSLAAFR